MLIHKLPTVPYGVATAISVGIIIIIIGVICVIRCHIDTSSIILGCEIWIVSESVALVFVAIFGSVSGSILGYDISLLRSTGWDPEKKGNQ